MSHARFNKYTPSVIIVTLLLLAMLVVDSPFGVAQQISNQSYVVDQPVRPLVAYNFLAGIVCTDSSKGKNLLALTNSQETNKGGLLLIDYSTGEGAMYEFPVGNGAWGLVQVPGNRLVITTYKSPSFLIFDLTTRKFIKSVPVDGEQFLWNCVLAHDGEVYSGSSPGGKLFSLNLSDYAIRSYSNPAAPNEYLRNLSILDDQRLVARFGMEKPVNLVFDLPTRQFSTPPAEFSNFQIGMLIDSVFYTEGRAFNPRNLKRLDSSQPNLPHWRNSLPIVDPGISNKKTAYFHVGDSIVARDRGSRSFRYIAAPDLKGGTVWGADLAGNLVGTRGQSYFVISKAKPKLALRAVPVSAPPVDLFFLQSDLDGNIWTGPGIGQTLCRISTLSLKSMNTDIVSSTGTGEVYDIAPVGDAIYCVAYSRGEVIRYKPRQPWDPFGAGNPSAIATLYDSGYVRPIGGIAASSSGSLFAGWSAKYGTYGGAVSVTDPVEGKTRLIREPLGKRGVSSVAVLDDRLYVGTNSWGNGLPNQEGVAAMFGIFDTRSLKQIYACELTGYKNVVTILPVPVLKKVICTADGWMRVFDVASSKFVEEANFPRVSISSRSIALLGDRSVVYGFGNDLWLMYIDTGKRVKLASLPGKPNFVESADGMIFASIGSDLYRIRQRK